MKKLLLPLLATWLLSACGGSDTLSGVPAGSSSSSSTTTTTVASVELLVSSPQLPSNDSAPVTVTALVLNAANQTMADQAVVIQTDSGYLTDVQTTTQANGTATAALHTSDKTNRNINLTATSGGITATTVVAVTGTRLTISGSSAIVQGDSADYNVALVDSGGVGISGQTVTFASVNGNTLNKASAVTDSTGQVIVRVTGSVSGADSITASVLGLTATQSLTVSSDSFAFSSPSANTEVNLGQSQNVSVTWTINNVAQQGQQITFASTRGTLSSATATTNSSGVATVSISSTNAGPATISATTSTGSVTQLQMEFVATTPMAINVQANPTSVSTNGQSTISAVVRDASNNLVKNKVVNFNLTDPTGGSLSVASATTDSEGKAQTVYTASNSASATNGVIVSATVANTSVTGTTTLTVGQQSLFISLGTGNSITEPNAAQYAVPYAIQVTDANGNGVAGRNLTVRVSSLWYGTGTRCWSGSYWVVGAQASDGTCADTNYVDVCTDEDSLLGSSSPYYRNGVLDSGEDFNGNGTLEAGNIATVTPTTVTTDSSGFALVNVYYPQEYAYWVKVELTASTSVAGSESSRTVTFLLPGLATDFNKQDTSPPGPISPFGLSDYGCSDPASFP
jgi:hypothetical protein